GPCGKCPPELLLDQLRPRARGGILLPPEGDVFADGSAGTNPLSSAHVGAFRHLRFGLRLGTDKANARPGSVATNPAGATEGPPHGTSGPSFDALPYSSSWLWQPAQLERAYWPKGSRALRPRGLPSNSAGACRGH